MGNDYEFSFAGFACFDTRQLQRPRSHKANGPIHFATRAAVILSVLTLQMPLAWMITRL
jgi:hypothetical protein